MMWIISMFSKKKVVKVDTSPSSRYAATGQGNYRVYRNKHGNYEAQKEVDKGEARHHLYGMIDTATGRDWVTLKDYTVGSYGTSSFATEADAAAACERNAKALYNKWLKEKQAGVVKELGWLP